jgi:broad specificity phosphatase PhoE
MATRVMVVRHAKKGNGTDALKYLLSPEGLEDCRLLGLSLPKSMKGYPVEYVGGSIHTRTYQTVLGIAHAAGYEPIILGSDYRLGSEDQLFINFGATPDKIKIAKKQFNNSVIDATRSLLTKEQYELLAGQLSDALSDASYLDGNVLLGTHSVWIQMIIEIITCKDYHAEVDELGWIVMDIDGYNITLVETNITF